MLAQNSAVQNFADYILTAHGADAQLDQTVAQKNARAGSDFAGEIRERGGDESGSADDVAGSNAHGRAALQFDGFVALQASSADLGALQILQNADGAVFFFSGAVEAFDVVGVIFVRAVGKVEAGNVHAQAKQVAHRSFGVAGRADGADDLWAAGGDSGGGGGL